MLNHHDYFDRRVIAAVRELYALQTKRFTIRPLETPYQKGWRRFYQLAEHARDRKDRAILDAILEVIGSTVVHHSRDFRRRGRRSRKLCEIEQPLRAISVNEWLYKRYPDSWLRYFNYELRLESNLHWQPYRVFAQPSLYVLRIRRHWIDQVRDIDPDIESRLDELQRWLETKGGWRRYHQLKGRRHHYWYPGDSPNQRELAKIHRQEIAAALIFPEADPAASARCARTSFRRFLFPNPKLRQRSIRLLTGRAGRKSLRVHPFDTKTNTASVPPLQFSFP